MSYIDPYEDLPIQPEQAFLQLEAHFAAQYEEGLKALHHEAPETTLQMTYIAQVAGALTALGLQSSISSKVPSIEDINYTTYQDFKKDVEYYKTMLKIQNARQAAGVAIKLDPSMKEKLRHLLEQIKSVIDKSEIDDRKCEALYARVRDLEYEINRDRTGLAAVGGLFVEACGFVGEGAKQLKPLKELIDSVGRLVGTARSHQEAPKLPSPPVPKQIEHKPRDFGRNRSPAGLDDDIPF